MYITDNQHQGCQAELVSMSSGVFSKADVYFDWRLTRIVAALFQKSRKTGEVSYAFSFHTFVSAVDLCKSPLRAHRPVNDQVELFLRV
jgi:hypothetical protein